jgi:hypothetical protein
LVGKKNKEMKGNMKEIKKLAAGSMMALAVFSAIAQCAISTGSTGCPRNISGPGGRCYNLTGDYDTAREACIGENGNSPVTSSSPTCGYSCDDGSAESKYPSIIIGTTPCPGDQHCG